MGRPSRYPWETWLYEATKPGGKALAGGIHFDERLLSRSIAGQLYAAAKKLGYRISIDVRNDMSPVRLNLRSWKIFDAGIYFDGEVHSVMHDQLDGEKPYDFIAGLKREADARGIALRATTDDLGNITLQSAKPSTAVEAEA